MSTAALFIPALELLSAPRVGQVVWMPTPAAAPELAPGLNGSMAPGWLAWMARLDPVLERAARGVQRRGRRATRLTIVLGTPSGQTWERTLDLPRAASAPEALRPGALGLLRLLVAQAAQDAPEADLAIALRLDGLVEAEDQPIAFGRFLARKRAAARRARLQQLLAPLVGMASLLGLVFAL